MAIKAVVLGYGLSGKSFHRYLILKEERITLHGVFARSPETQEQIKSDLPGATIYTDYAQVLSDPAVNLVIVATATNTHFEFTKSALLAGKHVVVGSLYSPFRAYFLGLHVWLVATAVTCMYLF
jgi:predicted dehydrogenase